MIRLSREFPSDTGRPAEDGQGIVGAGSCTRCNSHRLDRDRGVVETGVSFFREGQVVFCERCAVEVGEAVGMIDAARASRLEDDIVASSAERDRLEARVADLEPFVAQVRRAVLGEPSGASV